MVARARPVQREHLGVLRVVARRLPLVDLRHAAVQLAPAPVREALVGGVAEHGLPEAEAAGDVGVALEELVEAVPGVRADGRLLVLQHRGEQVDAEVHPEHGGPAQHRAVDGRERVDAGGDDRLDALRQLLVVRGTARRRHELLQEEGVAARAAHDRVDVGGGERRLRGGGDECARVVCRQRLEAHRQRRERRGALGGREALARRVPRDEREPRPPRHLRAEMAEQVGRRAVHPVRVLEDEQGRVRQERREQRADDAVQAGAAEGGVELVGLARGEHRQVERDGEQGQPRAELRRDRVQARAEHVRVARRVAVAGHVEQAAQQVPEDAVGGRGVVRLAGRRQDGHVRRLLPHLRDEPRLADPGVADELDEAAEAGARRRERRPEDRELALAVDEREVPDDGRGAAACDAAQLVRDDGARLALDRERLELVRLEARARPLEHCRRDEDLARLGAGHQARGQRGRVAEDRVRPAERRADLAREHAPAVDAHGDRQPRARVDDRADGEEHPVLVLADRLRRARDENDPAAVAVDVALEEGHAVLARRALHGADELVHGRRGGVEAVLGEHAGEPVEAQERDRRLAVLRLDRACADGRAHRHRDAEREVEALDGGQRLAERIRLRLQPQQDAAALLLPEHARRQGGGGRAREEDVAGLRGVLELDRAARLRPAHDQLAVRVADEEEVEAAAVEADVHAQRDRADGGLGPADRAQHPPHHVGRACRPPLVLRAREEEQQRVAAELQQAPAVGVGDVQQVPEGRVHDLVHLLGALLALSGQALGHGREAGDVDERHRPLQLAAERLRLGTEPLDRDAGDEGGEVRARLGLDGHGCIVEVAVDKTVKSGHNCRSLAFCG